MLQKIGICICLLATVAADWVKIPVLDPHIHEASDPADQYSYLMDSSNFLKVNTYAPLTRLSSSISSDVEPTSVIEGIPLKNAYVLKEPVQNNTLKSNQNMDIINTSTLTQNKYMLDVNTEIDPIFLQSVMNNSQKKDRVGLENIDTENKVNPFRETLKNVRQTLLKETPVTITGKIKFLHDLQTKLYSYIEPRIKRLWNVDDRQARTEKGMGFPSMDGALMTICFLLFAVFLIKLVKQLIQQLQDKANANALMMTGATPVVPAAGAANLIHGRRKRDISAEIYAAARILHLIESFHVRYKCGAAQ